MLNLVAGSRGLNDTQPVAARFVAGLGQDLDDVTTMQAVAQRDHAAVDLRSNTAVTDFGVNRIGEIDRCGFAREHNDLSFGSEGVNLFRVEIDLKSREKFTWVGDISLPFDYLPQPCEALFILRRDRAVFVLPMSGDTVLRHAVHLFGTNLQLERRAVFGDDRGVKRLIKIRPWHSNEVFDTSRDGPPEVVYYAEHGVAILHGVGDHAHRVEVVNLIDADFLPYQLLVDAEQALDAALDLCLDAGFLQFVSHDLLNTSKKLLALLASGLDCLMDLLIGDGVYVAEAMVFQFAANFPHAQGG